LHRIPFMDGDADRVVAFSDAHGGVHDARLLLKLTSNPDGVFVIGDEEGITLTATIVDRIRNAPDAAKLETLGVRAPIEASAFLRLVLEPAIAFTRAGERRALHVSLQEGLVPADGAAAALRDAGFAHAFSVFEMRRARSAAPPPGPQPLPAGWSWAALDGARADEAHAALGEIFRDALATSLMPLDDFRRGVASGAAVWRVLLDGDRIAGLVRVVLDDRRAEVRILGRRPAYRGRGLGPRLVAEGLRLLREGGAGDIDLSVETDNERALALYRRFGFEVVTRTPVFALQVR
jgi:ribosomal protein S18 acetylase RimI-like enzyme